MTKGLKIINSLSVASLMGIVGLSYAINRSCNNQTINKPGYSCY